MLLLKVYIIIGITCFIFNYLIARIFNDNLVKNFAYLGQQRKLQVINIKSSITSNILICIIPLLRIFLTCFLFYFATANVNHLDWLKKNK